MWSGFLLVMSLITSVQELKGMICNDKDTVLYRIPPELQCNGQEAKHVKVKVEKKNPRQYKGTAQSLQVISFKGTVNENFFGAKAFSRKRTVKVLPESQYREMIQSRTCLLTEESTGKPEYVCKSKWTKSMTTENVFCSFKDGYVSKSHSSHTISNLGRVDNCRYGSGFCFDTHDNIGIISTPNVQENEEYVLVGTHNASIISEHLLIPALGLSFKINNDDDDVFKKGFFKLTI